MEKNGGCLNSNGMYSDFVLAEIEIQTPDANLIEVV
jgi:hypothetical protein